MGFPYHLCFQLCDLTKKLCRVFIPKDKTNWVHASANVRSLRPKYYCKYMTKLFHLTLELRSKLFKWPLRWKHELNGTSLDKSTMFNLLDEDCC